MRTRQTTEDGFDEENATRGLEHRGGDPSGCGPPPRATEDDEIAPGNVGEPGGRWRDHEIPHVMADTAEGRHFTQPATELYSGGYLGTFGYGHGGKEGYIPSPESKPRS